MIVCTSSCDIIDHEGAGSSSVIASGYSPVNELMIYIYRLNIDWFQDSAGITDIYIKNVSMSSIPKKVFQMQ